MFTAARPACCPTAVTYPAGVVRRAKAGAVITYTVVLIHGSNQLAANSSLKIVSSLDTTSAQFIDVAACKLDTATGTAYNPVADILPAYRALVCSIPVTVTAEDIVKTELPSFTLTTSTTATPAYAAATTVAAVKLYTEPSITVLPSFSGTFATGEHLVGMLLLRVEHVVDVGDIFAEPGLH
jgi:hypothetical protein